MTALAAEVELKFQLRPEDLAALARHPLLGEAPRATSLTATYFDTTEHALRAAGLSLRIRSDGETLRQTLKAAGPAGLLRRGEWETVVAGDSLDAQALAGTPLDGVLDAGAALQPLFKVRVDRELRRARRGAGELELALDRGVAEAGERYTPLLELELELREGDAAMLFAAGAELVEAVPLRLSPRSKSETGYQLLEAGPPRASKAGPVTLEGGMTAAQALQAVGHACLRHWLLNELLVRAARDPDALHQARVALRRFRAALSLFRPLTGDGQSEALRARLRGLGRVLGAARDLDVVGRHLADGSAVLAEAVETRRQEAYAAAAAVLEAPDTVRLGFDWLAWLEAGGWLRTADPAVLAAPVTAFARTELARRRKRLVRDLGPIAHVDPEARHRARIHAKKLRYGVEFFASLAEGDKARRRADRLAAATARVQEALGGLQDRATRQQLLEDLDAPGEPAVDEDALLESAAAAGRKLAKVRLFLPRAVEAGRAG